MQRRLVSGRLGRVDLNAVRARWPVRRRAEDAEHHGIVAASGRARQSRDAARDHVRAATYPSNAALGT